MSYWNTCIDSRKCTFVQYREQIWRMSCCHSLLLRAFVQLRETRLWTLSGRSFRASLMIRAATHERKTRHEDHFSTSVFLGIHCNYFVHSNNNSEGDNVVYAGNNTFLLTADHSHITRQCNLSLPSRVWLSQMYCISWLQWCGQE